MRAGLSLTLTRDSEVPRPPTLHQEPKGTLAVARDQTQHVREQGSSLLAVQRAHQLLVWFRGL